MKTEISSVQKILWSKNLQTVSILETSSGQIHLVCSELGIKELSPHCEVSILKSNLAAISIVGEGFWQDFNVIENIEKICSSLEYKILESKNDLINVVIESQHLNKAINQIHSAIIID